MTWHSRKLFTYNDVLINYKQCMDRVYLLIYQRTGQWHRVYKSRLFWVPFNQIQKYHNQHITFSVFPHHQFKWHKTYGLFGDSDGFIHIHTTAVVPMSVRIPFVKVVVHTGVRVCVRVIPLPGVTRIKLNTS